MKYLSKLFLETCTLINNANGFSCTKYIVNLRIKHVSNICKWLVGNELFYDYNHNRNEIHNFQHFCFQLEIPICKMVHCI